MIKKLDRRVLLSTLWIFAILNYLYADVMTLMDPSVLNEFLTGFIGEMEITQEFLLIGGILMETAIVMVLLSRILKYGFNRWANIIVGIIHTLAVSVSLFVGDGPAYYYMLFAVIEIATTLSIIWIAWNWRKADA